MKRFLSLILALALICTMLPTVFAAEVAADERTAYKYNFGYGAFGKSSDIPISTTAVADTVAVGEEGYVANTVSLARFATDKTFANTNSAPWLAAGMHYVLDMKAKSDHLWVQAWRTRLSGANYGFLLTIDVPEAGEYTPVLEYQALANSYVNNIILIPEDDSFITEKTGTKPIGFWNLDKNPAVLEGTAGATAVIRDMGTETKAKYTLGTLDMQEELPDAVSEYKVFPNVTLEKKRYYLMFVSAGEQTTDSSSTTNKIETALRSFTLAVPGNVEGPQLKTVEASFSSDVIKTGEGAITNLALKYEDGSAFAAPYDVSYESLTPSVATIDENGVVIGVSEGKAKIKVTVTPKTDGAEPVTVEAEITVEEEAGLAKLHYNFGYESYGLNSEIPISTDFTKDTAAVGGEGYVPNTISIARFAKDKKFARIKTSPWLFAGMRYVYSSAIKSGELWVNAYEIRANTTTFGFAIAIDVPKEGEYTPALNYQALATGYINCILLVPEDDVRFIEKTASGIGFWREDNQVLEGTGGIGMYLRDLRDVDRENYQLGRVDMQEVSPDDAIERVVLDDVSLEKKRYYLIFDCDGQTVSSSESGSNKLEVSLRSFELNEITASEKVEHQFDYTEEKHIGGDASVKAYAVYGTDGEVSETELIETPDVTYGETCEVTAPEAPEGYSFLYWAKGATMEKKQIVSYSQSFDYLPSEGANYLIAVYKKDSAEAVTKNEYYNANGQLLTDATLPSMAGYGKATGWKEYGNGVFVAQYDDLKSDIPVTVDGKTDYYAYGDTVNCVASAPEGKKFMYWVKDNEIVSVSPTYSFSAWKKSTVEAVYGDEDLSFSKSMRKIVLGTFASGDYNAVMAEFIGFSDALEKGIMFGNRKIPMKSNKTQFTLTNDLEDVSEIKGYAIVKVGNELKLICDGSISVGE